MMMKWIRRIVLVFGFMLCMISEASADPQSGVRVSATRDKVYYGQQEVACLTVLVENVTDKPIRHVRIEEHLPDGLQFAEGLGVFEIDEIPANSSTTQSFYIRKRSDGLSVVVKADRAHYSQQEIAHLTVLVENKMDKPVYHVRVEGHLPDELQFAEDSGIFEIDEMPANSSTTQSFYVRKRLDGLSVVAKTDKAYYHMNEIAELRVVVTNHLDKPVKNVRIEHLLPHGLQYESYSGAYALENSTLEPGESIEYAVRVRVMDPLPETGDQSHMQMLMYMTVMLTAIMLIIVIGKCRGKM